MSLQLRLTLGYTLVLLVSLLGMGISSMVYFAQDLTQDFRADLLRLAEAHASRAVQDTPPSLHFLDPSPTREEIEDPRIYLLDREGQLVQSLPDQEGAPVLPASALEAVRQGNNAEFRLDHPGNISLWRAILAIRPIAHERRAVLYPFEGFLEGRRHPYLLMVVASDLATIRVLQRLKQSLVQWLLIGLALALLVGFLVARQVTRPLHEIGHTAYRVQQGELGLRIPNPYPGGEIGKLKQSLNAMLGRLENLMEVQRRFTADAAHDLRTPLSVIKSDLEITLRRERSAEEYREALERMGLELSSLIQLAEDLLMLSRLEAGQTNPFRSFFLHEALKAILPLHTTAAQNKGLSLDVQIPKELMIYGDEGLVVRAIGNLLANAVAYSWQGKLLLQAEQRGNRVSVSVLDGGPGIPQAERQQILGRFTKGERSSGAGLGLSIVAQVAQLHQGRVQIQDRAGGGAVFVLDLPEARAAELAG